MQMRFRLGTATGGFLQDWLVIGGFPNGNDKGYDTDFLQDHGGEMVITPEPGMMHKLPDSSTLVLVKITTRPIITLIFLMCFRQGNFTGKVIYAFTKVKKRERR